MDEFTIGRYTVQVGAHVVSATRDDGKFHNSNVDYYYEEGHGYGCKTAEEVAIQYVKNCKEWDR